MMKLRIIEAASEFLAGLVVIAISFRIQRKPHKALNPFVLMCGGVAFIVFAALTLAGQFGSGVSNTERDWFGRHSMWATSIVALLLAVVHHKKNPKSKNWRLALLGSFIFACFAIFHVW